MVNLTTGSNREPIDPEELEALLDTGTVVIDNRRWRSLYRDGQFITAAHFTRDQNYFLTRQSDLCKASGFGVVEGLMVRAVAGVATSIEISAGQGITVSGELVILPETRRIDLADIAQIQRLDVAFGLITIPREPARTASGLFVVALRPVEFTADPIATYPTSLTGERSVNDGSIIEASAVTLIPYPDPAGGALNQSRARVVREIFVEQSTRGIPTDALPLAMIALSRGIVQWVDPFMVRRETGAEHGSILGMGFAPRGLREAQIQQYDQHLSEVLRLRDQANRGRRFSAAEHFQALPPTGRLPSTAIDPTDFTQIYFPATVDVDLAFIPSDEIAALIEESLLLPPIDLTLSGEALDSTSVLVLIPTQRQRVQQLKLTLPSLNRQLLSAAPGLIAQRKSIEVLQRLRVFPRPSVPIIDQQNLTDRPWREALNSNDMLWYVRRRNLAYRLDVVGFSVPVSNDDIAAEVRLNGTLSDRGLLARVSNLRTIASAAANARLVALLGSPKLEISPILLRGAVRELEAARTIAEPTVSPEAVSPESATPESTSPDVATPDTTTPEVAPRPTETLDQATVFKVAERFGDPKLGEGIQRLEAVNPQLKTDSAIAATLADSGAVPELDRLGRVLPAAELPSFTRQVLDVARRGDAAAVQSSILRKLQELGR